MKPIDPSGGNRHSARQRGMTLIELLAGIAIASVLSVMMLGTWFALSDSYSFTVHSDKARDKARLGMSRMAREIRDAENSRDVNVSEPAVVRARPYFVVLYTTFNKDGNENAGMKPRRVMYRLYSDGELWRFQDLNNSNTIGGVNDTAESWPGITFNLSEQLNGEGAQLVTDNVVNMRVPSTSAPTPLFEYVYFNEDGTTTTEKDVRGIPARLKIKSVEINLLVDTNPEKSPVYTNLQTTAQLRNQR